MEKEEDQEVERVQLNVVVMSLPLNSTAGEAFAVASEKILVESSDSNDLFSNDAIIENITENQDKIVECLQNGRIENNFETIQEITNFSPPSVERLYENRIELLDIYNNDGRKFAT